MTWTGRCIKEGSADGEEVMLTNWIMTPNPEDGAQHLESIQVRSCRLLTIRNRSLRAGCYPTKRTLF